MSYRRRLCSRLARLLLPLALPWASLAFSPPLLPLRANAARGLSARGAQGAAMTAGAGVVAHEEATGHGGVRVVGGFRELEKDYDAFILDQFGVMHNGGVALPGAIDCFNQLVAAGKKIVVLSNTSQRAGAAVGKLPSLGFDTSHVAGLVCSGEEAWHHVAEHRQDSKCLFLTWEREAGADASFLKGLSVTLADATEADFILCHGAEMILSGDGKQDATGFKLSGDLSAYNDVLDAGVKRGLEMVCCNPDIKTVMANGNFGHMPGAIAEAYERKGGTVRWFGKPHAVHFEACLKLLPPSIPRERVVHVGDSLEHDVAGARNAQLSSVFIAGGIHNQELGLASLPSGGMEGEIDEARLSELCARWKVSPTVTSRTFVW
mmetsp:Transcript_45328/g.108081  ORF Transcript_45328/g.108081 Transcript_45328/m.108081 type:complete len:377 (+) Transcript_45328:52-1182(+)